MRQKIRVLLLLTLLWPTSLVLAQNKSGPTNLTAANSACLSTSCVSVTANSGTGSATIYISANASGNTIQFEDLNGNSITSVQNSTNSSTQYSSTTATGTFQFSIGAYGGVQARMSTLVSGTTTVTVTTSTASARSGGGGGGGISGLTTNVIPMAATATTLTDSHCDDGKTTAATITCSEPIASGTTAIHAPGGYSLYETGNATFGSSGGYGIFFFTLTNNGADKYQITPTGNAFFSTLASATNCAAVGSAASPSVAACGSAMAGMFSCATNASTATCQVNTTAVTANSEIFITQNAADGGMSQLNVTCNTTNVLNATKPLLVSKSAGVSFTINLGAVSANPACFEYHVIN